MQIPFIPKIKGGRVIGDRFFGCQVGFRQDG